MGISRVIYGGSTLIDLRNDTVTADKLLAGYTAHDASGNIITGTLTQPEPVVKVMTTFPATKMTANDESSTSGLIASASSVNGSYAAYKAFSCGDLSTSWASAAGGAVDGWIQLQMPKALSNIRVVIKARSSSSVANPVNIEIAGGTDGVVEDTSYELDLETGEQIAPAHLLYSGSISDTLYKKASSTLADVQCTNSTAYNTVRIIVKDYYTSSSSNTYVAIGDISITGLYEYA